MNTEPYQKGLALLHAKICEHLGLTGPVCELNVRVRYTMVGGVQGYKIFLRNATMLEDVTALFPDMTYETDTGLHPLDMQVDETMHVLGNGFPHGTAARAE